MGVAQISTTDFRTHVPSIEWTSRELDTSTVKHHTGHCWKTVPPETQVGEPIESKTYAIILNYDIKVTV